MNLTKKLVVLMVAVFVTLLGASVAAKSPWQTTEFDFLHGPEYVSCLGEEVTVHNWITIRFREFETLSGNYHYIEYWTWDAEWIGQDTGRVWLGNGKSPGTIHAAKGEVGQWTSRELARPIIGDGPKFRYNQRFKYTVNANGDLKVFYEAPAPLDDLVHCLGPND